MKEIIGAVVVAVSLWKGTSLLKSIHDIVKLSALEKAAQGLPSLTAMNRKLHAGPLKPTKTPRRPDSSNGR